jgi:hypothetical protein
MPRYRVRINGGAEFEVASSSNNASGAADEIRRYVRTGDGDEQEIKLNWDNIAVLEVTKISD